MNVKDINIRIDKAMKEKIDQQQSDLLEAYKTMMIGHIDEHSVCEYCSAIVDMNFKGHEKDCIILKAGKYIREHE
jgi:hypothetical protein